MGWAEICLLIVMGAKRGLPWWLSSEESIYNAIDLGDVGSIPGVGKISLEKGKATHTSVLAWRIPWTV